MTISELKELARHAAKRTAPTNFSVESVDAALADEFKSMTKSVNDFLKNRYDIYAIITENADEVVPNRVIEAMGQFAEVRNVAQGDRPAFKRNAIGKARAKKFLTQVGLSGVYESARLDTETFELKTKSIGGAVTLDFERMLDGAESLAEFMAVLAEAQVDAIYKEVQDALVAAVKTNKLPAANRVKSAGFNAASMVNLINTTKAYGGAVIFAAPEFIAAMGPDAIGTNKYAEDDINSIHNMGKIHIFRGAPVVELPQSFTDETNAHKVIDPRMAYILPTAGERVVKVVLEGNTQIWDVKNADQSIEIQTYRKVGVGILAYNNWCVYCNTALAVPGDFDGISAD